MPVSFRLELFPKSLGSLPVSGGEALHGMVFGMLLAGNPVLAKEAHDARRKPFALSPLEGSRREGRSSFLPEGRPVSCVISFLNDAAVDSHPVACC